MIDKFKYVNNFGETLQFGEGGVNARLNDLRDYAWSYTVINGVITGFSKEIFEKQLPVQFIGASEKYIKRKRNNAFSIVEKDVLAKRKGRLYVGKYYLNCWIFGADNDNYLSDGRTLETTWKVVTDDPYWRRDADFSFAGNGNMSDSEDVGKGYPYGYPYDYSVYTHRINTIDTEANFPSDFTMTIEGPCVNPTIIIGGHTYKILDEILAGEYVTIESSRSKKTITKTLTDRSEISIFNKRYKAESVFEQIPGGVSSVSWSDAFKFVVTIHELRSEPVWDYEEKETIDKTSIFDLLDNYGNYILDSMGEKIEVQG